MADEEKEASYYLNENATFGPEDYFGAFVQSPHRGWGTGPGRRDVPYLGRQATHYVNENVLNPDLYGAAVIADGATEFWRQGESSGVVMVDSIGGHDGSYENTVSSPFWSPPTLGTPGLLTGNSNTATTRNGSTQVGVVPAATWQNPSNQCSFEMIIKPNGSFASLPGIFSKDENSVNQSRVWLWYIDSGGHLVFHKNPGNDGGLGTAIKTSTAVLANNGSTGYHLVMAVDNTDMRLYINGVIDGSPVACAFAWNNPVANMSRVSVGGRFGGGNSPVNTPFAGIMDEVALYRGVKLSAAQALNHAQIAGYA